MKRFSLKKAKLGNEVCTKSGKKAQILLFDRNSQNFPLVVIIEHKQVRYYTTEGKYYVDKDSELDLKML
ncbi:MAG: hypothetical protein ACRCZB_03340 [Bacteroidales bacterium]